MLWSKGLGPFVSTCMACVQGGRAERQHEHWHWEELAVVAWALTVAVRSRYAGTYSFVMTTTLGIHQIWHFLALPAKKITTEARSNNFRVTLKKWGEGEVPGTVLTPLDSSADAFWSALPQLSWLAVFISCFLKPFGSHEKGIGRHVGFASGQYEMPAM